MRALGELIVVLLVGGVTIRTVMRRIVTPHLRRRRTERLLRENAELDEQLRKIRKE